MTKTIVHYVTLLINDSARTHAYVCHKHKYENFFHTFFCVLLCDYEMPQCKGVKMKDRRQKKFINGMSRKVLWGCTKRGGKKITEGKKECWAFYSHILAVMNVCIVEVS